MYILTHMRSGRENLSGFFFQVLLLLLVVLMGFVLDFLLYHMSNFESKRNFTDFKER